MFRSKRAACVMLTLLPCSVSLADYPTFQGESLIAGRAIWIDSCEGCHAYGIAGAPLAGDTQLWEPRVAKGMDVLYANAIEGFFGPGGTMMPPRGGNDSLTDEDVRAAVDYMVQLAVPHSEGE